MVAGKKSSALPLEAIEEETGLEALEVARLLATSAGRRALSRASLTFFDHYYCNMSPAPFRERWLDKFQTVVEEARASGEKGRMLIQAPRNHGKSEAAVSLVLWLLCLDRNIRILLLSEAADASKKKMGRLKALMLSERVLEDWCSAPEEGYGPWQVKGQVQSTWSDNSVYVNRTMPYVDPTLSAVGYGSKMTGGHPDVIIADDIQSDDNAQSPMQRKRLREWFVTTLLPMLNSGGSILVIGTRKHGDDLYHHLEQNSSWNIIKDRAIIKWPAKIHEKKRYDIDQDREILVSIKVEGDYEVLWPGPYPPGIRRDLFWLLAERAAAPGGTRAFNREYQNIVVDDTSAPVALIHLDNAIERGRGLVMGRLPSARLLENLVILQCWDFSLVDDPEAAEERDSDYTVGLTLGKDLRNGQRYVLDLFRERGLTDLEIQAEIKMFYAKWTAVHPGLVRMVVLERNSFGQIHFKQLRRSTDLPLKGHLTGKNKTDPWEGVPALSALIENEKLTIASGDESSDYRAKLLRDEYYGLGRAPHDDIPMSLWIGETRLGKMGRNYRYSFGEEHDPVPQARQTLEHPSTAQASSTLEQVLLDQAHDQKMARRAKREARREARREAKREQTGEVTDKERERQMLRDLYKSVMPR